MAATLAGSPTPARLSATSWTRPGDRRWYWPGANLAVTGGPKGWPAPSATTPPWCQWRASPSTPATDSLQDWSRLGGICGQPQAGLGRPHSGMVSRAPAISVGERVCCRSREKRCGPGGRSASSGLHRVRGYGRWLARGPSLNLKPGAVRPVRHSPAFSARASSRPRWNSQ